MKCFLFLLVCMCSVITDAGAQINIPHWPQDNTLERSTDYEVSVRAPGGDWQPVEVLTCQVNLAKRSKASFAEFDMNGTVEVRVKSNLANVEMLKQPDVVVRPQSRGIKCSCPDVWTVQFTLHKPEYLSVEFGGDRRNNLHLFANPLLTERHTADEPQTINWASGKNAQDVFLKDARLIYFGPGVHKPKDLPGEDIKIPSNCTVYLAPGAVVKARLIVDRAENVRIIGRGIIDHPLRGIEITFSKNVLVDGPTVLNPRHYTVFGGQSEGVTIRNLKAFSCMSWSDGIDLMCCRDVTVEDVFLRNSDDCIALYNHRWWYWGGTENINVRRATLWADVAHPVNIGSHGDDRSEKGETLHDVNMTDCDILYARTNAALNFSCGDKNTVSDVTFRDIRVERVDSTALVGIAVVFGAKYNRAPGNGIDRITFENVSFTGDENQLKPSFIRHYDAAHGVGNVRFDRVTVNGRKFDPKKDVITYTTVP